MSYPITDRNGFQYHNAQDVTAGIAFLEEDADYLDSCLLEIDNPFVADRIKANAANSRAYAEELRQAMDLGEDEAERECLACGVLGCDCDQEDIIGCQPDY